LNRRLNVLKPPLELRAEYSTGSEWIAKLVALRARAIAYFSVVWDQLASSAGPPLGNVEKFWWAGAAKRRWPWSLAKPTRCP